MKTDILTFPVHRTDFLHWLWQLKFSSAKVVNNVTDKMMHACGGTGYKVRTAWLLRIEINNIVPDTVKLHLPGFQNNSTRLI